MILRLERILQTERATFGIIREIPIFTLELPWQDNYPNISCIPVGCYPIKLEDTKIRLFDVPKRNGILIHKGNKTSELRGCIAVGLSIDLNANAIWNSSSALDRLINLVKDHDIKVLDLWQLSREPKEKN